VVVDGAPASVIVPDKTIAMVQLPNEPNGVVGAPYRAERCQHTTQQRQCSEQKRHHHRDRRDSTAVRVRQSHRPATAAARATARWRAAPSSRQTGRDRTYCSPWITHPVPPV